ncbi:MAG: TonB-dependent receptor [Bacteroidales bacterium]|nr:TonB-dependent receptor [Bacteroidales bacterium]
MKNYFFAISFLLFSYISFSQTVTVLDEIHLEPVENVLIFNETESVITNISGKVQINTFNIEKDIVFKHTSYKDLHLSYYELKELDFTVKLKESIFDINEVVVSASSWEQNKSEVPNRISVISKNTIKFSNSQTSADLLKLSGEVFIQKSQLGGGSPMIRGFSANRVLLVVDGVRMNNAIFRSGNLQNVISLDANSIESSEIIFGPGSVIYGSDALGGVMDFHTIRPRLSDTSKLKFSGKAMMRFSSANKEKTGHIDFNIASKKFASLTAITYSDYDDLIMGNHGNDSYVRPEYVDFIDGVDVILKNINGNVQKHSAYDQLNILQKFRFQPNKKWELNYGFYYSVTSDIPRYDRLIQYKDDELKYAEWYYGPQEWMMNSLKIKYTEKTIFFDNVRFISAYQDYTESRHDRKFRNEEIRSRTENVKILTNNLDFEKKINAKSFLFYGTDVYYNKIFSSGYISNISTGIESSTSSRYPDQSLYMSFSGYVSYKNNFNKKLTLNTGIRYNKVLAFADLDTVYFDFPFETINLNTSAVNGSFGLVYKPVTWQFSLNASSGFRAPNIDDLAKVFDSEPGNVVVPNDDLKPETAYNLDIGILKRFNDKVQIDGAIYYTYLDNALIRSDYTFNGADSILYDGEMSKVQAVVNADNAIIYGFQISLNAEIANFLSIKSNYNYTQGEDSKNNPLRHVAPSFGSTHLIFKKEKIKIDFFSEYNSEMPYEKLAESERSKPYMYAVNDNGDPYSPSWFTFNFNMSYQLNRNFRLHGGIENIFDQRYRPYSSGIIAPGRNFIFSVLVRI